LKEAGPMLGLCGVAFGNSSSKMTLQRERGGG
jgi:hypothetical protein